MKPFNRTAGLLLAESKLTPETRVLAPASTVLQGLLDDAPADQFTLAWLLGHLQRRSFGFIMLLLPGISYVAGLLLAVPAIGDDCGPRRPCHPPSNCHPSSTNAPSRRRGAARCGPCPAFCYRERGGDEDGASRVGNRP
jgi:hypothetical protein